jgi:signal recognition particle subunit SRP72
MSGSAPSPEDVIKHSNSKLKKNQNDLGAQHDKIVALLNLDRFGDVIRFVEECGDGIKKKAQLEHAYALYKTGELEQARDIVKDVDSEGARHLEAQLVCNQPQTWFLQ